MNSSERVGTIPALWRYPVKSMLGEELYAVDLSEGGLSATALTPSETGKPARSQARSTRSCGPSASQRWVSGQFREGAQRVGRSLRLLGGRVSVSNSPVSYASTTAWTRSRRSSFWRMCVMCVLTVVSLM
jgi:hypothetical protein